MTKLPTAEHWIDEVWLKGGAAGESVDPATGAVIGRHFVARPDQAVHAIAAARRSFVEENWREDRNLRADLEISSRLSQLLATQAV